jgi:hypothetical protein
MKKLLHKLRKRKELPSSRITSETVAEHREHILAGGRRFKYPIQYARHKLVINAIIISVVALVIVLAVGWWQLYPEQNTSEFMYRVTKVIPVPVATIDGQPVLYSDYLMAYISSVHYLEQKEQVNFKTDDGRKQIEYIKQQSIKGAVKDAYASKLAKNLGISVSDSELESFIKDDRRSANGEVSEQTYYAVIMDYYNWSPSEYRYHIKNELLCQKVVYAVDKSAQNTINNVANTIKNNQGTDLKTLATTISSQAGAKAVYGTSGWVPKFNTDGGLAIEAAKIKKLQTSPIIKSTKGDGYYIIRLLDSNDSKVSYEYIQVPLTAFTNSLNDAIKNGKLNKYISV